MINGDGSQQKKATHRPEIWLALPLTPDLKAGTSFCIINERNLSFCIAKTTA
jgi:hypothetical protein